VALAIGALHGTSGGAERVLVDVANGLHRRGYRVTVLTYQDRNGPTFYPLDYGIERHDGRVRHRSGAGGPSGRLPLETLKPVTKRRKWVGVGLWVFQYGPRVRRLRRLLADVRPDVAVGFMPSTFPYLVLAGKAARVPVVASIHNVPDRELGGDPRRWDQNPVDIWVRNRALRMAAATTVLLPAFVEQMDEAVRPVTHVVPNMIRGFGDVRADVRTDPDDNVILAIGRLSPAKDHETLVRAWSRIEADHPSWRVRIIGNGPLADRLADLIDELGVERVTIDPPTQEIAAAYASAKLFAMPSLHEGFGLVTAEALACGLPVVGFADCEGTNEIVLPGENGVLVDPADDRAAAFAQGLAELIDDDETRLAMAADAPASVERFSEATVLDAWERLIHDVVGSPDPVRRSS
jgi:glycosyltransferase involved in cell wall biosynthesis